MWKAMNEKQEYFQANCGFEKQEYFQENCGFEKQEYFQANQEERSHARGISQRKRKEKKNYMSMKKDQTIHKGKVDLKKIWSMKRRMKRLTIKRTR